MNKPMIQPPEALTTDAVPVCYLNRWDIVIACAVSIFVSTLAFLWPFPYPHPDLWPCLSTLRAWLSYPVLGTLGHLAIGVFTGCVYLGMRLLWFLMLDPLDDFGDHFFFAQAMPMVGSVCVALLPPIWRAAQHLSPVFFFLSLGMAAVLMWLFSRGSGHYGIYFAAYFIFGVEAAVNPICLGFLVLLLLMDRFGNWFRLQLRNEDERIDEFARSVSMQEGVLSIVAGVCGFAVSLFIVARYAVYGHFTLSTLLILGGWLRHWTGNLGESLRSPLFITVLLAVAAVFIAQAFARHLRLLGSAARTMSIAMLGTLSLLCFLLVVRSSEGETRLRLGLIRTYLQDVVDDTRDIRWLFTDGRLDDMLRYELAKAGSHVAILDTMSVPSGDEILRLKALAPDFIERDLFASGGSEVFRAWARERPERLAESAWFTGGGILKLFGKTEQRTFGSVFRSKPKADRETTFAAADARQADLFERVLDVSTGTSLWGRLFGSSDSPLQEKFDALLWRVGRLEQARSDQLAAEGKTEEAQTLRDRVMRINSHNTTLVRQGSVLEQMLPTATLVLTSREALDVALKRADFVLAQRYARAILLTEPDDGPANFALAMAALTTQEYLTASVHFKRALKANGREPASLNNLAICYLKLGHLEEARDAAEQARKLDPKEAAIQKTLAEVDKALQKRNSGTYRAP